MQASGTVEEELLRCALPTPRGDRRGPAEPAQPAGPDARPRSGSFLSEGLPQADAPAARLDRIAGGVFAKKNMRTGDKCR